MFCYFSNSELRTGVSRLSFLLGHSQGGEWTTFESNVSIIQAYNCCCRLQVSPMFDISLYVLLSTEL